jgi:hypothetical protein
MSYERLPYDDASTTAQMTSDARAAGAVLRAAVRPAPSIRFEDYPQDLPKPAIEVSEAASRLAAALHLHLD